jgi:hypothetical protein
LGETAALKGLIAQCRLREARFHSAAARVQNAELKRLLEEYSLERAEFAIHLERELAGAPGGEAIDAAATPEGHRGWLGRESASTGSGAEAGDLAALEECAGLEQQALASYRKVLWLPLSPPVRGLLERHFQRTAEARKCLEDLAASLSLQPDDRKTRKRGDRDTGSQDEE